MYVGVQNEPADGVVDGTFVNKQVGVKLGFFDGAMGSIDGLEDGVYIIVVLVGNALSEKSELLT